MTLHDFTHTTHNPEQDQAVLQFIIRFIIYHNQNMFNLLRNTLFHTFMYVTRQIKTLQTGRGKGSEGNLHVTLAADTESHAV